MTRRSLIPILLLATGCTVGPDYKRPEVEVPAAYKENRTENSGELGWKQAEPSDLKPRGEWWTIFGDPELDALMKKVDVSNQTIAAAEAQVRISAALADQARASWWPTVGATAQVTKSKPSGTTGPIVGQTTNERTIYSLPLQASWEVDLWGRIRRLVESGDAATAASASGTAASSAAMVVIMIGRKRTMQAWKMALSAARSPRRCASMAKSIIMMAFFLTMPMSSITPISEMMFSSEPVTSSARIAPTPAEGSVERMVIGCTTLS